MIGRVLPGYEEMMGGLVVCFSVVVGEDGSGGDT